MEKIKLLPQQEILKIAAGQVVDRPANIVKELVENSVDADSTKITVYIQDGGKRLIRVVDNGCGMSKKDAKNCFKKHATSKIQSLDDLDKIQTFGFRGEALASISAVSKVTLLTKEKDTDQGLKLELEDGKFITQEEASFTQGTDLSIQDVFYNTPVRQKFLKKRETEQRHITQLIQSFCLDYLNITFKFFVDDKQVINCPATDTIIKRASQLWGHGFAKNLVMLEPSEQEGKPSVSGAITNHQYFRYDRNSIFLFVNNRWVKNHNIQSALLKGYINVLPPARYPAAFIFVKIDPALIDVNIHPRKEEVKFLHPRAVPSILQPLVKKALEKHLSNQINKEVTFKNQDTNNFSQPTSSAFKTRTQQDNFTPFNFDQFLHKQSTKPNTNIVVPTATPIAQASETPNTSQASQEIVETPPTEQVTSNSTFIHEAQEKQKQTEIVHHEYEIIGQYKNTYILIEKEDGLFFVDQHVAHERVLYQVFSKRFENIATIKLLFPQFITLKEEDISLIEEHIEIFKKNGIDLDVFGQNQIKIQATPVHLKSVNLQEIIQETLASIKEFQGLDPQEFAEKVHDHLHSQMACKAAVKAGDILTFEQMKKLLRDLDQTEGRFACPHGRPIGWMLSHYEIEKKFKR